MNVIRTFDKSMIKSIVCEDDIFYCTTEDGFTKDQIVINTEKECWLKIEVKEKIIGVYRLEHLSSVCIQIHAYVLPKHRKEHSFKSGIEVLRWIFEEYPCYKKVVAVVPVLYPNVKNFCVSQGFREEGCNRLSHLKEGSLHDQTLLGITRDEIEERLKWAG